MKKDRLEEIRAEHRALEGERTLDHGSWTRLDRGSWARCGELLAEVDRLREGILRYRVAQGHHLPEAWAEYLDNLAEPDPIWKALSDARGAAKRGER